MPKRVCKTEEEFRAFQEVVLKYIPEATEEQREEAVRLWKELENDRAN